MNYFRYLLLFSVCMTFSYIIFHLIFRKDTGFRQQRLFLIISIILTILLPFLKLRITFPAARTDELHYLRITEIPITPDNTLQTDQGFDYLKYSDVFLVVYILTTSILLVIALFHILRIRFLIRSCRKEKTDGLVICSGEKIGIPFSFLKWIFIPDDITDQEEIQSIIAHERIHAIQLHSADNIFMEIICAVMWFNPFAWLMRKTIRLMHEYLADEGTIGSGIDMIRYQVQLVNQAAENKLIHFESGFNDKQLKKRIIMMTKTKNQGRRRVRILNFISLPAILIVAMASINGFFPADAKAQKLEVKKESKQDQKEVTVVGYGTSSRQDQKGKSDKKDDLKQVTVVGYSTQKQKEKGLAADTVNYILDGVRVNSISDINPDSIASVNVLKQDRLIIIRTKSYERKLNMLNVNNGNNNVIIDGKSLPDNVIYIVDDKKVSKAEVNKLSPEEIESLSVLKGKDEVKKYSNDDYDGVIIITTKKP